MSEKTHIEKIVSVFFEKDLPTDLILLAVWLAATIMTFYLPLVNSSPIKVMLTLPIVLIIPGYCFIAAIFPKKGDLGLIERIMLSIIVSIAFDFLMGLALYFTPWGIRFDPLVITLTFFTIIIIPVAYYRRNLLPIEEQLKIPFSDVVEIIGKGIFPADSSGVDRLLIVILILVIIVTIITTTYVIASPKEGERFTEFYILSDTQIANDYPHQIIPGINYPMFIGVGNQEHRNVTYTIETWMLRTEFDSMTNTSHIITMDPGEKLSIILVHNETRIIPYNLSIKETGYDRMEFLLFNESVPGFEVSGNNRINASYRDLHLWIDVR
jgi:uncharacterized membrane protein